MRVYVNHALDKGVSKSFSSKKKESFCALRQVIDINVFNNGFRWQGLQQIVFGSRVRQIFAWKIEDFCKQQSETLNKTPAAELLLWHGLTP